MAQDGHFDTRDRTFCHNFIAFFPARGIGPGFAFP